MKMRLASKFVVLAVSVLETQNHSGVLAATESATPGVASAVIPPQEETSGRETDELSQPNVPKVFDAPFGSYPNLLDITEDERESFSPVVFFPTTITGETKSGQNKDKINNLQRKMALQRASYSMPKIQSYTFVPRKRVALIHRCS